MSIKYRHKVIECKLSRKYINYFLLNILNMFRISKKIIRKERRADLLAYFAVIEKDINSTFQEIKREYERE